MAMSTKRRGLTYKLRSLQRDAALVLDTLTPLDDMAKPCIKNPTLPEVSNDEDGAVHLVFDQSTELLCFTMELSSDPGEPKHCMKQWMDQMHNIGKMPLQMKS